MKNFRIKNIVLLLAVCLGTTAAYSSGRYQGGGDMTDDMLSCGRPSKPPTKPVVKPLPCIEEPEYVAPNTCKWTAVLNSDCSGSYISGLLSVKLGHCGTVTIDSHGCITKQTQKETVQAIHLLKVLCAANSRFTKCYFEQLISEYEKCPCPTKPRRDCD